MAVLPIVKYGSDVLRKPTEPVTAFDDALQKLIDDMVETMYAAPGVGLAANQIGVSKRLCVIDLSVGKKPGELHVCVNPDLTEPVIRPARAKMRYLDRHGVQREMWGDGLMARAMCHETDHLNGMLYVDHLRGFKKDRLLKKVSKLAKSGMW